MDMRRQKPRSIEFARTDDEVAVPGVTLNGVVVQQRRDDI
jgi:hypothetical protein